MMVKRSLYLHHGDLLQYGGDVLLVLFLAAVPADPFEEFGFLVRSHSQ